MRVITRGEVPQDKPIEVQYRNCKSVIEFRPSEVTRISDQRDGDFYRLRCPVCEHEITKGVQ